MRRLRTVIARTVDVKLIAATNAVLPEYVAAGRFRADLYHHLAVVVLPLPPLRERGEDIMVLAQTFLQQYALGLGVQPKRLSVEAATWLQGYAWPGNVRELSHVMERVTILHAADDEAQVQVIDDTIGSPRLRSYAAWTTGLTRTLMGAWEDSIAQCQQAVEQAPDPSGSRRSDYRGRQTESPAQCRRAGIAPGARDTRHVRDVAASPVPTLRPRQRSQSPLHCTNYRLGSLTVHHARTRDTAPCSFPALCPVPHSQPLRRKNTRRLRATAVISSKLKG